MPAAYKFYRIYLTKNSVADLRYYTINTFSLYESSDGTGLDVARSGTATSNGDYMTQAPALAVDGDNATYWESSQRVTAGSNGWLQVELPTAKTIKSFRIISTTYPNEKPRDFLIQGSNDGSSWTTIASFVDFLLTTGDTDKTSALWFQVRGVSTLANGSPSSRVLIHSWSTGALLASLTPDGSGLFTWVAPNSNTVMVTHTGPTGYRPICDGPVTPAEV